MRGGVCVARGLFWGGLRPIMRRMAEETRDIPSIPSSPGRGEWIFHSDVVDRVREAGNVWDLPGGQILLPDVLGFCRGVERALGMLYNAVVRCAAAGRNVFLLGEIIHNPWVNEYFRRRGVRQLTRDQGSELEKHIHHDDCAVIPAFGVSLTARRALDAIGCEIVDTSCGDVRGLWRWGERAVAGGYGVLIFGRARHDETVVTKSRLAAAGGRYVVVGDLDQTRAFCRFITERAQPDAFAEVFGPEATNASTCEPFDRLAQVSQTTMLYDETMAVREILHEAFVERFGEQADERLLLHPTVCRATQDRQAAAEELCRRCDLAVVVGGFGSSNTRHLYELASFHVPSVLIEGAASIKSVDEIESLDAAGEGPAVLRDWLPPARPLRIALLAGASCPEVVIGEVLERLGEFLS